MEADSHAQRTNLRISKKEREGKIRSLGLEIHTTNTKKMSNRNSIQCLTVTSSGKTSEKMYMYS